ncbi:FecR family protein [Mucilaginibacter limnophilus]|uniref:FecR family protein n=1 Tax=Mucilaginibacter limnophilus TaxID=1932778 RepID=A0A3S2Y031_9SPHI|nr:FecR family protein [Mucilaginibacter limnophilus]RVU00320.1 FecR family protein [Mucilaginibacter limnophilus]
MDKDRYISLYEKWLAGECSEQEKEQLLHYRDNFGYKEYPWEEGMGDPHEIKAQIHYMLQRSTRRSGYGLLGAIIKWSVAASIVVGLLTVLYKFSQGPIQDEQNKIVVKKNLVKPGTNKATLTLADGTVIALDNSARGLITNHDGINVQQRVKGQLIYETAANTDDNASVLNTISTPFGGQYQIILQDGTKVWLNAASSLKFPAVFNGNDRQVEITGEVYFEVAKNPAKPFRVKFNGNTITVLGTHFDVMAYPDEAGSKVTLVEGAVNLANTTGTTQLKPGMQAMIQNHNSTITTHNVDVEEAIAWKKGYFLFNNENIQSIMRKISRWYNVDISYEGNMRGKEFSGSVSRFKNVNEVLDMLELTESIRFKIEGRRIKVMP